MRTYLFVALGTCVVLAAIFTFTKLPEKSWPGEIPDDSPPKISISLFDPEEAPIDIRPQVMLGYRILLETKKYAKAYAGDRISCTNCHFQAGNTQGGVGNGISLVGVTNVYPRLLPGDKTYTLEERINACFEKSMNGKPLPLESKEMQAIVAYLNWISLPAREFSNPPWLGLKGIETKDPLDPKQGQELYMLRCSLCHGKDGKGKKRNNDLSYPPLWGPDSFNSDAGMNKQSTLSAFIFNNMPYQEPDLTIKESIDIASFILNQKRPEKID